MVLGTESGRWDAFTLDAYRAVLELHVNIVAAPHVHLALEAVEQSAGPKPETELLQDLRREVCRCLDDTEANMLQQLRLLRQEALEQYRQAAACDAEEEQTAGTSWRPIFSELLQQSLYMLEGSDGVPRFAISDAVWQKADDLHRLGWLKRSSIGGETYFGFNRLSISANLRGYVFCNIATALGAYQRAVQALADLRDRRGRLGLVPPSGKDGAACE